VKLQGFSKLHRILHQREYSELMRSAKRFNLGGMSIFYKHKDGANARLGVSVPKRAFRLAVQRNAVKRMVRECFRVNKQLLLGLDIIVVIRKELMLGALRDELQAGFGRLKGHTK
jgi:ribonuclease P protein component